MIDFKKFISTNYSKKFAQMIKEAGKSRIYRVGQQAGVPEKGQSCMSSQRPSGYRSRKEQQCSSCLKAFRMETQERPTKSVRVENSKMYQKLVLFLYYKGANCFLQVGFL